MLKDVLKEADTFKQLHYALSTSKYVLIPPLIHLTETDTEFDDNRRSVRSMKSKYAANRTDNRFTSGMK